MSNLDAVERVLAALAESDRDGWRATLARTLAASMDEQPQASTAAQLRAVMGELEKLRPAEVNVVNDLAARRAARLADAAHQPGSATPDVVGS